MDIELSGMNFTTVVVVAVISILALLVGFILRERGVRQADA